jgi:hypothetical protein
MLPFIAHTTQHLHEWNNSIKWNQTYTKGAVLSTSTKINTLRFADDKVIIANSKDNFQRGVFALKSIAKTFGVEIPPETSEKMAILRQFKFKTIYKNFKCVDCEISYENEF